MSATKELALENSEAMQQWEAENTIVIVNKTKEMFLQINEELHHISKQCEEGELSNLDALIKMRDAKKQAEATLEIVKEFESNRLNEIANEASQYPNNTYNGLIITSVNGRKTYSYKNCPIVGELEQKVKDAQEFYKSGFEGYQKGTVQAKEVDGVWYFIDVDGDLQPFPELSIGKSFLMVKEKK